MTYMAVASALILIVAVVAVTASQPPPPSIAEFAPQAVTQIKKAPQELSSTHGTAAGSPAATKPPPPKHTAAQASKPPVIQLPRVRDCVGNPPRQIEDPQSPPCVPYWDPNKDNGGATWKGVSRDEIRVIVPSDKSNTWTPLLQAFFNSRFEFYGRHLNLISDFNNSSVPDDQRAWAVRADEVHHVFASATHDGDGIDYYQELARRHIVSAPARPVLSQKALAAANPYIWQYPTAIDQEFAGMGQWLCNRVANQPARHAQGITSSGRQMAQQTRKFGLIVDAAQVDVPVDYSPLVNALKSCNVTVADTIYAQDKNTDANAQNATSHIAEFRSKDITSIICLCYYATYLYHMQAANSQSYFPEWIEGTYYITDNDWLNKPLPANQKAGLFGLTWQPRQESAANTPAWWAVKDVDPNWGAGQDTSQNMWTFITLYHSLLLLASGIQMAGPHLTPTTFAQGLQRADFPNPFSPIMAGDVGFAPGSHTMTLDAAEYWYSNSAPGPYSDESAGGGTICYVDGGRRYRPGAFPKVRQDPFFVGSCDSGA
jgi:hypothetical protein